MTNSQKAFIKYQLKYLAAYEFGIICLFFLFAFIFGNYSLADFNSSFNNLLFFAPFVTFHWLDQESFKLSLQYSLSRKFYIMMILLSAIISAVVVYGIILIIGLILQNLHAGVQTLGHFMVLTSHHWLRNILEILLASLAGNFTSIYHRRHYLTVLLFVILISFFVVLNENLNNFTTIILLGSTLLAFLLVIICNRKRVIDQLVKYK